MFEEIVISELSEVELAIYRFIMAHDHKISYMRVREIAEGSHTSATSVMRFVKKIGFDSFPEFKLALKKQDSPLKTTKSSFDEYFDILNKKNFKSDLEEQINLVAEKMIAAGTVLFLGIGASGAIGTYASRKMANLGLNALSLTDQSYPFKSHLRKDRENILVILSVSGNTSEMIEAVNQIDAGDQTKTVLITSNPASRLANKVDYVLDYVAANERTHIYMDLSSQIPCVFILELIIKRIIDLQTT